MALNPKKRRRLSRKTVLWYLLGVVVFQLGLGVVVEWAGSELRDPNFAKSVALLSERCAATPSRPLMLVLGSSRTVMGFDAGMVARADGESLVFNFSAMGSGPVMEQVYLRRLIAGGVRPDLVLIEVVPLCLATGTSVPTEDTSLDPARLSWAELTPSAGYFRYPIQAYAKWLKSRCLVCLSLNTKIGVHASLRIDEPRSEKSVPAETAGLGFCPHDVPPPDVRLATVQDGLRRFAPRLQGARLAEGPARAVRDLIGVCRQERLPYAVLLMPEGSGYRDLHPPTFRAEVDQFLAGLQAEDPFELIDARTWVADDGFWDAHHLHAEGARVFSERFVAEALPRLRGHSSRSSAMVKR